MPHSGRLNTSLNTLLSAENESVTRHHAKNGMRLPKMP